MTELKLQRLPERVPVKITMTVDARLHRLLQEYAAIYAKTYGTTETVAALCPYILQAFLDSDRDFLKARKHGEFASAAISSAIPPPRPRRGQSVSLSQARPTEE